VRRGRPAASRHLVHMGALGGGLWAALLATQYVAAQLAYHPHLGPWLYRASDAARGRFSIAMEVSLIAAAGALLTRRWRWGVIPLSLVAATAVIARDAPLYAPDRIFVWYSAYHGVHAYRQLFLVAWSIFAVATVAGTVAAARLLVSSREPTPSAPRQPERYFHDDIIN